MEANQPRVWLNLDVSNLAVSREALRLAGFAREASVGQEVVFIPFRFNVYTYLVEHLRDYGVLGTLTISFLIGVISARLEGLRLSVRTEGLRACIYAYLTFSLFADLANLAVGWWLALAFPVVIVPVLGSLVKHPPRDTSKGDRWILGGVRESRGRLPLEGRPSFQFGANGRRLR
jgi:hypothetical protein